jgi:serine peptidase DegS
MNSIKFLISYTALGAVFAFILLILFPQLQHKSDDVPEQKQPFSFKEPIRQVLPAVVSISVRKAVARPNQSPRYVTDGGSGVLVDPNGLIVTNYHVIHGASDILVELYDGRMQVASVLAADMVTDLAVLKITLQDLPYLELENKAQVSVGDMVFAIGSPYRLGQTVTMGIVSAVRDFSRTRSDLELIQTDATINPGNSGGALINANGELIGINSSSFKRHGNGVGISFALASSVVSNIVDDLKRFGRVKRGWLGAGGDHPTTSEIQRLNLPHYQGVLISQVYPNSPAAESGLAVNDYITHINEQPLQSKLELTLKIANSKPDEKIQLTIIRDNKTRQIEATLREKPSSTVP